MHNTKPRIDLTGRTFGRLTVVEYGDDYTWKCLCLCGATLRVTGQNLRQQRTASCGCLRSETARNKATKHGHATQFLTPTYQSWRGMLTRCSNPRVKSFRDYGSRGINVCERWKDFSNFLTDMGERPDGLTLDRIDNEKGYSPDNCRWATYHVQRINQRRMVK
jgi:hypothetical protein